MADDLYAILGVAADADPQQITRAFRHLVRALHPDAAPATTAAGTERLTQVLAAWHILHDPAKRAAYDRTCARTAPQAIRRTASGPLGHPGDDPDSDNATLLAGPTLIHARPAPAPGPHIRVGPPVRLGD